MKPITNSHLLGYIGECVVAKYFGATMSKDRYDDEKDIYHFGASLKDLGKKWFAVSKMDINSFEILGKLK